MSDMNEKIRKYTFEQQSEFINFAIVRRPVIGGGTSTRLEQAIDLGLDLASAVQEWKFIAEYYESVLTVNGMNIKELRELLVQEWQKKIKEDLKKEEKSEQSKITAFEK